jgi:hypothetical protein
MSVTPVDEPPCKICSATTRDSRVVDKDMKLTLISEYASFVSLEKKQIGTDIREKLLRRLTNCKDIREIELQENGLLSGLFLKLCNHFIRLLSAARREVNLCVVYQELLQFDEFSLTYTGGSTNAPLQFLFRYQNYHLWKKRHVEHKGARALV